MQLVSDVYKSVLYRVTYEVDTGPHDKQDYKQMLQRREETYL